MTGSGDGELEPGVEAGARSSSARGARSDEQASVTLDLAEVYRRHADFVWRVVRRLGVPDGAVEDVMHEVFLVVHRRLHEFDGRAAMTTWLYNVARGVVSNDRRSRSREARRLELVEPKPPAPDPEVATGRKQAAAFVRAFVASLDDDKRMVFELADLEGMPIPEVAAVCGIKVNTAYSRLRAARQQFQRAVGRFRREQSQRSGAA
jgi:RNA polymerase sigma-70 factor (ECF subfamily)